jgi:hypothetical protein
VFQWRQDWEVNAAWGYRTHVPWPQLRDLPLFPSNLEGVRERTPSWVPSLTVHAFSADSQSKGLASGSTVRLSVWVYWSRLHYQFLCSCLEVPRAHTYCFLASEWSLSAPFWVCVPGNLWAMKAPSHLDPPHSSGIGAACHWTQVGYLHCSVCAEHVLGQGDCRQTGMTSRVVGNSTAAPKREDVWGMHSGHW